MASFARSLVISAVVGSVCGSEASLEHASSNALGPYNIKGYSVSGLSAGGYMAVQMHITYSSIINGSAVFAGASTFYYYLFVILDVNC